jgi:hypothetical protein
VAWADKAYDTDMAHQLSECSNAGLCDRNLGKCVCFSGYSGHACQRSLCPDNCNSNGVCTLIKDISYDSIFDVVNDDDADFTVYNQATNLGSGPTYSYWDQKSVAVCECDPPFFSPDCSLSNYAFNYSTKPINQL